MLKNRAHTRSLIRFDEGRKKHAYKDSRGVWTIGDGRNVDNIHPNKKLRGGGLRECEMDFMLDNDLDENVGLLETYFGWFLDLDEARQAVMVDMVHQLGFHGFLGFDDMLSAMARKDYQTAAAELMDSDMARQTPERAKRNRQILLTGEWPN